MNENERILKSSQLFWFKEEELQGEGGYGMSLACGIGLLPPTHTRVAQFHIGIEADNARAELIGFEQFFGI